MSQSARHLQQRAPRLGSDQEPDSRNVLLPFACGSRSPRCGLWPWRGPTPWLSAGTFCPAGLKLSELPSRGTSSIHEASLRLKTLPKDPHYRLPGG